MPNRIILAAGQHLWVSVRNDQDLAACAEPQAAGRYFYAEDPTPPYTWLPSAVDQYSIGIRAYGMTATRAACPSDYPVPCPSANDPAYCAATACQ